MKKAWRIILITLISLIFIAAIGTGIFFLEYKPSITADFSSKTGEISNGASGFLYGFAEPDIPTAEIAESIDVSCVAQKTYGGLQHPIGDVNQVAETFINAGGDNLIVYTQDMYSTWYYKLDSMPEYLERVRQTVTNIQSTDYADKVTYCIYNETNNGEWFGDFSVYENRVKFYEAWKETFELVKSINPKAKIGGPGYYDFNEEQLKEFLLYCTQNNCIPEVVIWHELGEGSLYFWNEHFEKYDAICSQLGLEKLPVNISEYGLMRTNGMPGESVKWINRIEGTHCTGCVAYWRLANNLSDVVSDDVMPNSNWWVYRWYSEMSGQTVAVRDKDFLQSNVENYLKGKSEKLLSKGFSGVATIDEDTSVIQILVGGTSRDAVIKLRNLDDTQAYKAVKDVMVKIEYVDYKGLSGAVSASTVKEYYKATIANGRLNIELDDILYSQGFLITVVPTDENSSDDLYDDDDIDFERYEAEASKLFGTAKATTEIAYAASQKEMVKADSSEQSGVIFAVNADDSTTYKFDLIYGNGANGISYDKDGKAENKGERTNLIAFVQIDDNEPFEITLKNTIKDDYTDCVSFVSELKEGKHKIKIYIDENKETNNTVSFDFLDMTENKAKNGVLIPDKDRTTVNNSAFIAITEEEGYYTIKLDCAYGEPTELAVNSSLIRNCSYTKNGSSYTQTVYLRRGLSYIEVNARATGGSIYPFNGENTATTRLTAGQAELIGSGGLCDDSFAASKKHIDYISSDSASGAVFNYNAETAGLYQLAFSYANNEEGGAHDYNVDLVERYISLFVNDKSLGNIYFRSTQSWQTYKTKTVTVELSQGQNTITITNDGSYKFNDKITYAPYIDYIELSPMILN